MPETTTIEVVEHIDRVPEADWNAVCGAQAFVDHRWLQMVEAVLREHEARYVLLRRDGHLAAAAVCGLDRRFEHATLQRRAGWMLRHFPYLRCSIPIAFESGVLTHPDAERSPLVLEVLGAVRGLALREHALLTTFGNLKPEHAAWPTLRAGGCRELSRWWSTGLSITWLSFDAYLASRTTGDRKEIGRLRRRIQREGITVEHGPLQPDDAPRLRVLIDNVLARHHAPDPYGADFLQSAASILGSDLQVVQARQAGETVGCAVLVKSKGELLAKWAGMDYAKSRNSAAYHAVLIGCIQLAIELGVQRLRLGATAVSTKQQFGAVPEARLNAIALPTWLAAALPG
jgi:predicted N-acyltransferase